MKATQNPSAVWPEIPGLDLVYPSSVQQKSDTTFYIARIRGRKMLVLQGSDEYFPLFDGKLVRESIIICDLNHAHCLAIRSLFPFTAPVSHRGRDITIGLGDRLGLASAGHIRLVRQYDVFPVLAQQSIRELNLTGRNYQDVLDSASWAVFQEGYTKGFGADGDHLKTAAEVKMALDDGFTMITLDCSEHIRHEAENLPVSEVEQRYAQLPQAEQEALERKYSGKVFPLPGGHSIRFTLPQLKRIVLIYADAVRHAAQIYHDLIKTAARTVDFELSIDETLTATSPASHFFTASELTGNGVALTSLAPRFIGEFQKGIDYRGDVGQFTADFTAHVKIAEFFGYKLSIHSGSDKFLVFPIIGEKTGGRYHLKTAGTNWLEAVRLLARIAPDLYRRMHQYALEHLEAARKYYHISADPARVAPLDTLEDQQLPALMDQDDARQILHITYGLILQAQNPDGSYRFKDEIYSILNEHETEYYEGLKKHIGRHFQKLGLSAKADDQSWQS